MKPVRYLMAVTICCVLQLFIYDAAAENPYIIDLSQDRSFERVKESGIPLSKLVWRVIGEDFYCSNPQKQYVTLRLPGGGEFTLHTELFSLKVKNGKVYDISCNGEPMPIDEVYTLGRILCETFKFPLNRLEEWHAVEITPEGRRISCSFGIPDSEPRVHFQIQSSASQNYPWMMVLSVAWDVYTGRDRSQTPPPFLEPIQISLDPPSGRRYDRMDDVKEVLEAHAADPGFEARYAAQYPEQYKRLMNLTNPNSAPPPPGQAVPAAAVKTESETSIPILWWLAILAAVVLFGFYVSNAWKRPRR